MKGLEVKIDELVTQEKCLFCCGNGCPTLEIAASLGDSLLAMTAM
jgi:hypothetical protein